MQKIGPGDTSPVREDSKQKSDKDFFDFVNEIETTSKKNAINQPVFEHSMTLKKAQNSEGNLTGPNKLDEKATTTSSPQLTTAPNSVKKLIETSSQRQSAQLR